MLENSNEDLILAGEYKTSCSDFIKAIENYLNSNDSCEHSQPDGNVKIVLGKSWHDGGMARIKCGTVLKSITGD